MFNKSILYYESLWSKKVLFTGREQPSTFSFLSGYVATNHLTCNKTWHTSPLHDLQVTRTLTFFQCFSGHLSCYITNIPNPATLQSVSYSSIITAIAMENSVINSEIPFLEGPDAFQCTASLFLTYFSTVRKKKDAFILPPLPDSVHFKLHKTGCL